MAAGGDGRDGMLAAVCPGGGCLSARWLAGEGGAGVITAGGGGAARRGQMPRTLVCWSCTADIRQRRGARLLTHTIQACSLMLERSNISSRCTIYFELVERNRRWCGKRRVWRKQTFLLFLRNVIIRLIVLFNAMFIIKAMMSYFFWQFAKIDRHAQPFLTFRCIFLSDSTVTHAVDGNLN